MKWRCEPRRPPSGRSELVVSRPREEWEKLAQEAGNWLNHPTGFPAVPATHQSHPGGRRSSPASSTSKRPALRAFFVLLLGDKKCRKRAVVKFWSSNAKRFIAPRRLPDRVRSAPQTADGAPVEPRKLTSAVPNWRSGDTTPLDDWTLRVLGIRDDDAAPPPVLVVARYLPRRGSSRGVRHQGCQPPLGRAPPTTSRGSDFQSEQLKSGGRDAPAPHNSCASLSGARTRRPAPSRCGRAAAQ
jgi:hypothetical protein